MNYLKQKHTQCILLWFLAVSLLCINFSEVDLRVSGVFFYDGFYHRGSWWVDFFYGSVAYFVILSMSAMVCLWLTNRCLKKNLLEINGRKTLFLALVLLIGSGFIVNYVLKENFGRPRPRDIVEFSGTKQFQPAFAISEQCSTNCSFSNGHGSGAFFALALSLLFKNRRLALLVAATYGSLVSLARIAAGAHFFSDSVTSFFIMLITADILYYYFFVRAGGTLKPDYTGNTLAQR